jgi:hypothetical protein
MFASETFFNTYPERPREWPYDVLATYIPNIKGANSISLLREKDKNIGCLQLSGIGKEDN